MRCCPIATAASQAAMPCLASGVKSAWRLYATTIMQAKFVTTVLLNFQTTSLEHYNTIDPREGPKKRVPTPTAAGVMRSKVMK